MLYNLDWLSQNKPFPPAVEASRIKRYKENAALFDSEHFETTLHRHMGMDTRVGQPIYDACARRISRVVGNFEDIISFPVLLNYQRLMSLKVADLVCGEHPTISGSSKEENERLREIRETTDFDSKQYSMVIDMSRYGNAVIRVFKDDFVEEEKNTFTVWDPAEWYPIVANDGTYRITHHCLCWLENRAPESVIGDYYLTVQIHGTKQADWGHYEQRVYRMQSYTGNIGKLISAETRQTGLGMCAVHAFRPFATSSTVYGYDDYMPIDAVLAEIIARIGQISVILDKHADPNITGPVSMLKPDPRTGELKLQMGKFFGISPGETPPEYMTWEGQLTSAFKELEMLFNQLYILSEMGSALLGGVDSGTQAVSGTATRYKMAGPLSKARRVANALTLPTKKLLSQLSSTSGEEPIPASNISISWADGLPDDPREKVEMAKLATGAEKMMPLEEAIMEFFGKSNVEAREWIAKILSEQEQFEPESDPSSGDEDEELDVNHAGRQDGTGVNPMRKGSTQGINNAHSSRNP